jgi:hypothetical protein
MYQRHTQNLWRRLIWHGQTWGQRVWMLTRCWDFYWGTLHWHWRSEENL